VFSFKTFAALAALSTSFGICAPAQATSISAWVSGYGQDFAGCGLQTTPCRTFQYAHDNVLGPNGGDILLHEAGSFGPMNITKGVSVLNDGVGTAGTGAPSGKVAVTISTNSPVLLKGLTIDGVGGGYGGINITGPANVTISGCTVQNFSQYGVQVYPSADVNFSILNTLIENNGKGVYVNAALGGRVRGSIKNTNIFNNFGGIEASAGNTQFTIFDSLISNNYTGLNINGASTIVTVGHSNITWNTYAYTLGSPAVIQSFGDNAIVGNGGNAGSLTPVGSN
jgi:hypothetical protein